MLNCVKPPKILLPKSDIDRSKWAVVACDQFTSEVAYWEKLERYVGYEPSTLRLILPEVYLNDHREERVLAINHDMQSYLDGGLFNELEEGFILVDRQTAYAPHRLGLVVSVDLEAYSYVHTDKAMIRATEGTILERIPPRVEIREKAPLELSHIMLLIDDRKHSVIESLYANRHAYDKVYDFDLNMNGGHITGYHVKEVKSALDLLEKLLDPSLLMEKYATIEQLLFAVGDGNHSLATAKTCWEAIKKTIPQSLRSTHPARYALCEIVNIHDDGLKFEPIHRVLFGADFKTFVADFKAAMPHESGRMGRVVSGEETELIPFPDDTADAYKQVQAFLDAYKSRNNLTLDYVHGADATKSICQREKNCVGILMPTLDKSDLFGFVIRNGSLPRKTFSMGEATEKRYYVEAKRIK